MKWVNPILLVDSYKLGHREMYPKGTQYVYSNFTPRSSRIPGVDHVVFAGLQYFLAHYMTELMGEWFAENHKSVVGQYRRRVGAYLGVPPSTIKADHISDLHYLGYMPLEFHALPEGTPTPLRVPMLTVENTHPNFAWLTNYVETIMSNVLWKPCTSATTALRYRMLLTKYAALTGGDENFVAWQGHDFSFRGMSGVEDAMLSAFGHILSFTGSDTLPIVDWVEHYYPGDNGLIAGSVPASEHSVMSCGGAESELETFARILDAFPTGIVSVVSDTWNLWKVITEILPQLSDRITQRDGKLVIRPDSGDPVDILCGLNTRNDAPKASQLGLYAEEQYKGVVELLWDRFGGTVNSAGYRTLHPGIGVIYGDSITPERAEAICARLRSKGFASTIPVLGIGSYSYEYVTRDTYGFAMKATHATVNGEDRDLFKKPITDDGTKFSATGRLAVTERHDGELCVIERATLLQESHSLLRSVWRNGRFIQRCSLADVRSVLHARTNGFMPD